MIPVKSIRPPSSKDSPLRFLILFLLCFIVFGVQYSFDIPQALEQSFEKELNISETEFNLLYSVFASASIVTAFFFGFLIDKVGSRIMLILLSIFVAVFEFVIAFGGYQESFTIILIGRVLLGLVCESLISVQLTIVTDWFRGKQLSLAMGLALTSPELGDALNSYVTPKIEQVTESLGTPILVSALICTLGVFVACVVAYIDKKAEQADNAALLQNSCYKQLQKDEDDEIQRIQCKDVTNFKFSFWLLCLISTLQLGVYVPFLDNGNRLLQKRFCFSASSAGQIVMGTYLVAAILSPLLGMIVDKIGQKRIFIFFSSGVFILAHAIIMLWPQCKFGITESGVMIGYLLLGVGYCLYANCIAPAIPLMVNKRYTGTAFGLLLMMENIALALFPIISGAIVGSTEQPEVGYRKSEVFFFGISSLSLIICFGMFFLSDHHKKKLDANKEELESLKLVWKGVQIEITASQVENEPNEIKGSLLPKNLS